MSGMIVTAVPPVEMDVRAEPVGEENQLFETSLAGHVTSCWNKAKFAKMELTERLLKCERQRRGAYDPDRALEIAKTGGSDIFMMLTDVKCRAAESWIKDVLLQVSDRPFDLAPSEDPKLPPEVRMDVIGMVRQEAHEFLATGAQLHPETFRKRIEQIHDQIAAQMKESADDAARRMENVIEDQLEQGGWRKSFGEFVNDFCTYPTAILKGPTVRRKKRLEWGPKFTPIIVSDFGRDIERVSPFDIYPSPNASGVDDGYIIQRHRLTRGTLSGLLGIPGYSDDNIQKALDQYGAKGYRTWITGDQERDNLEGKPHSRLYSDNLIEALEFWGPASGQMLIEWGMKDVDPYKEYEVNAWMVGPHVIKCIINPDPLGRRPYDIASFESIPGSFWGIAIPELMRDVQVMCNASARALANNMAISSGPQVEATIDRLADGEDVTSIFPWKIWQVTSDRTGGGQPAIRFYQPETKAAELLSVFQHFARQADEVTGIPNYVYGSSAVAGAGRTASGLSMLMDNAAKGIKQAIANLDRVVEGVVSRLYIHNMMYHTDPFVKGDFRIVSKGATGLIAREQLQIRRNEFLAATGQNPIDMQIIGLPGRAYLLRENARALQLDTDKIVPSTEQIKFQAEKAAILQAQMAQAQMAGQTAGQMGQQPEAPTTLDAAGNPAGGMNLVQPQM